MSVRCTQPPAVVTEEDCQSCDFNKPNKTCLRKMDWVWRGETYAGTKAEYIQVKKQIETEIFDPEYEGGPKRYYRELGWQEQEVSSFDRSNKNWKTNKQVQLRLGLVTFQNL